MTIQSFKAEFRLAGGVNLPKIIDCVGSDGKERRQLVKVRLPFCGVVLRELMKKVKENVDEFFLLYLCLYSEKLQVRKTYRIEIHYFLEAQCFSPSFSVSLKDHHYYNDYTCTDRMRLTIRLLVIGKIFWRLLSIFFF